MTAVSLSLEALTSPLLGAVQHGFFSRRGGASSGIFEGLNCGGGSSDQTEIVELNRDRVARAMGLSLDRLVKVHQVHSADVVTATAPLDAPPKADAIVSSTPGLALTILTADCQPVLFADVEGGVIGAAHAGWRGTFDGVLEATVAAMEALGAERPRIRAAIGPTISQGNYEVGQEFFERFVDDAPENARFFVNGVAGKYLFDLPGYGLHRLRGCGIAEADWIGHCTYGDAGRFFSYRRSLHRGEADYGRLISTIRL